MPLEGNLRLSESILTNSFEKNLLETMNENVEKRQNYRRTSKEHKKARKRTKSNKGKDERRRSKKLQLKQTNQEKVLT